jgi:hypothetical protein
MGMMGMAGMAKGEYNGPANGIRHCTWQLALAMAIGHWHSSSSSRREKTQKVDIQYL